MAEQHGDIRSEREAIEQGQTPAEIWLKHIERAKEDEKDWREKAKEVIEIYEAEPDDGRVAPRFNIVHSNIATIVPALYNSTPIPDVRRRFGDKDPVAKQGVDIIERAVGYSLDQYDFDDVMSQAVTDSELAGRGTARVRYEPSFGPAQQAEDGQAFEPIESQQVTTEHVIWDRWGHAPARSWAEMPWIFFEHDLTEDDMRSEGVDEQVIRDLTFDDVRSAGDGNRRTDRQESTSGILKTVKAYEVWDKRRGIILWVAPQLKERPLKVARDMLRLPGFFPMPEPIISVRKRALYRPVCPYEIYKPLVEELESVTRRIGSLIKQLRVRGLIDSELEGDFEKLKLSEDGHYESVENAARFAAGSGGLESAIAHWPMDPTIKALGQLYIQREQVKQTIFEVTGLSDILRGATNAAETATAQQLKTQWGSQRIQAKQGEVARFARDLFRMKAHIICSQFESRVLSEMTQIKITPEVEQLVRSAAVRGYRIDIESDSTVRADMSRTQEQMTGFMEATGSFVQSAGVIAQQMPQAMQVMVEVYTSFARKFKLGKQAEDALEGLSQSAQQASQQPPQPSPEKQKMQADMQMAQQKAQADAAAAQQKAQSDMQMKQLEMQVKQLDLQTRQKLAEIEIALKQAELVMKQQEMGMKRESLALDRDAKQADVALRAHASEQDMAAKERMGRIKEAAARNDNGSRP